MIFDVCVYGRSVFFAWRSIYSFMVFKYWVGSFWQGRMADSKAWRFLSCRSILVKGTYDTPFVL